MRECTHLLEEGQVIEHCSQPPDPVRLQLLLETWRLGLTRLVTVLFVFRGHSHKGTRIGRQGRRRVEKSGCMGLCTKGTTPAFCSGSTGGSRWGRVCWGAGTNLFVVPVLTIAIKVPVCFEKANGI